MQKVKEIMIQDHEKINTMIEQFKAIKSANKDEAKKIFKQFDSKLLRHLSWEENILFPLLQKHFKIKSKPAIQSLLEDHQKIRTALERMSEKIFQPDPVEDLDESQLLWTLSAHVIKEDSTLYEWIDQLTETEMSTVQK